MKKKELEKDLQKDLVKYLKLVQRQKKFIFFHVKNDVGGRKKKFFFDLKPLGVLPGVCDFVFLKRNGKCAFLEIKTSKGRLSEHQKDFINNARALGHSVDVAFGWKDILEKTQTIIR